jgi:hypothetical protein
MELLGYVCGFGPELLEVAVQIWIDAVEGVQVENVDALAFVDHQ